MNAKLATLLALTAGAFAQGAIGQYLYPGDVYTRLDVAFALFDTVLVFAWYRLDADERGFHRSPWLSVGIIGLGIVAMPWYFFRSRGARGGAIALGIAVALLVAMDLLTLAGEYATYYGVQDGFADDVEASYGEADDIDAQDPTPADDRSATP